MQTPPSLHPERGEPRTVKRCSDCKETKLLEEFFRMTAAKDGRQDRCKICLSVYHRDPDRAAKRRLYAWRGCLALKGITEELWQEQHDKQDGVCAICAQPDPERKLAIDHDHSCCPGSRACGKCFRGLLCGKCNRALGLFGDDPGRVEAALLYLRAQIGERLQ